MEIKLSSQSEELVKQKVKSGFYKNASEVVEDALRLMEDAFQIQQKELENLKQKIEKGFRQLDQGECSSKTVQEIIAEAKLGVENN